MPITCLIVDDSTAFLSAATRMLEAEGIVVIGVASSASSAIACAEEARPDVALVDVDLGEEDGFEVAELLALPGLSALDGAAQAAPSGCVTQALTPTPVGRSSRDLD